LVPIEDRTRNLLLFADVIGRFRKEIDPHYQRRPDPVKLSQSAVLEIGIARRDLDRIADPVARASRKAAIRARIVDEISRARQERLLDFDAERLLRFTNSVVFVLRGLKGQTALVAECVKRARLTDKEAAEIRDQLEAAGKQGQR
jgi:hypothetical protein